jgi:ABC-type microcin C transport system duplicated ATPase subunit YejF
MNALLSLQDVSVTFSQGGGLLRGIRGEVRAVRHVSLSLPSGITLGVVGESGSGKTTLGRAILQMIRPQGRVVFDGVDLTGLSARKLRPWRRHMQLIFQDPYASLNPRMTIAQIMAEPLRIQGIGNRRSRRETAVRLLERMDIGVAALARYPREFSGGQRQRIAIARALALEPRLLILDEPTSALDASIQARLLNLLQDLQKERELTYIFISHDLATVGYMADRIAVMKDGAVIEQGPTEDILAHPQEAYTRQLLAAVPQAGA